MRRFDETNTLQHQTYMQISYIECRTPDMQRSDGHSLFVRVSKVWLPYRRFSRR